MTKNISINIKRFIYLPQELGSSLASSQSALPSQYHDLGMHMRDVWHWNVFSESHWSGALDAKMVKININTCCNNRKGQVQVC